MFTYLAVSWQRYWLIALLVIWAILLFGGFVWGQPDPERTRRMPTWTRMASSLVLVIAGWSWVGFSRGTPAATPALFLALGMSAGFLGDLFMAGLLGGRSVLAGMGAFGLGHVFYIAGIWRFSNQAGLYQAGARWGGLAVWWLVGLLGWYFVVYRGQTVTVLHQAALPYALLLASTAGLATGLALQSAPFAPLALGAALFLVSDLLLAADLFNDAYFPLIGDVVWLTYGPGQMLIVFAAGTALRLSL